MTTMPPRPQPGHRGFRLSGSTNTRSRLTSRLAKAGWGQVFLAHDTLLDRPVAIKFIKQPNAELGARFLIEAKAAARVQHPNHRHDLPDRRTRRGTVHRQRVRARRQPGRARQADRVARRAPARSGHRARAWPQAHRRGVLHRDVKPANVIVNEAGDAKARRFRRRQAHRAGVSGRRCRRQ